MARQKPKKDKNISGGLSKTDNARQAENIKPKEHALTQTQDHNIRKETHQQVFKNQQPSNRDNPIQANETWRPTHYEHKPERKHFVENYELPRSYDTTGVALIARDPNYVHAHWDIAANTMEEMRKKLGGEFERSMVTLRMYDVTSINFNGNNANAWFDIDIGHDANSWYVNLWADNVAYCADLGVRTPGRDFIPIARSNFIFTPPANQSARSDVIWMDMKGNNQKVPFILIDKRTGKARAFTRTDSGDIQEVMSPRKRKRLMLTEDDIRAYYSRMFPMLRKALKRRGKLVDISDELRRKLRLLFGDGANLDDLINNKLVKRLLMGASEELWEKNAGGGMSSETLSSRGGASEQITGGRKFFFELWTELLVYGRTEPNAQVFHGGRHVPLRPDGTFSMRFSLPSDTRIPLDFTAHSFDNIEKRVIDTSAERSKTTYGS